MFEHYRDVMDVFDVAEALCIGKNREIGRASCRERV